MLCFLLNTNRFLLPTCYLLESLPTVGLGLQGLRLLCHVLGSSSVILPLKVISCVFSVLDHHVSQDFWNPTKISLALMSLPFTCFPHHLQHWENGLKSPSLLSLPHPNHPSSPLEPISHVISHAVIVAKYGFQPLERQARNVLKENLKGKGKLQIKTHYNKFYLW